jgi:rubrerythrin
MTNDRTAIADRLCSIAEDLADYGDDSRAKTIWEIAEFIRDNEFGGEKNSIGGWVMDASTKYRCSDCGYLVSYPYSFCPSCGTRMEAEQ